MTEIVKKISSTEVEERFAALLANANAVRAIASAVEGTLGPKGLDCMLVDRFGDVTLTNDGSTILDKIDVSHPAARLLINTAKAQEREVGDGTTTATLLAATLILEGVNYALKGVPIAKLIEGMRAGLGRAAASIQAKSRPLSGTEDPLLLRAALVAARGDQEIATLALEATRKLGRKRLLDPAFRLEDWVVVREGARSEVVDGLVLDKGPLNRQMPAEVKPARLLLLDDSLEPEELEAKTLATEPGFARHLELRRRFQENLGRLIGMGVNVIAAHRGVDEGAEEFLTAAGALVLRRLTTRDLTRIAEHTAARPIKRSGLSRSETELEGFLGEARLVRVEEKLNEVHIRGGKGKRAATLVLAAATPEVRAEKERIARDALSAVQQALRGGVVPGGGAAELAAVTEVAALAEELKGMAGYGASCVVEALKRPLSQIVANAGFNSLEKVQALLAAAKNDKDALGIDCDSGEPADMLASGVVDATPVKLCALRTAGEMAEAILRIGAIIRKREPDGAGGREGEAKSSPGVPLG